MWRNRLLPLCLQILLFGLLLGLWEWRAGRSTTLRFFISTPSKIAVRTATWILTPQTYLHASQTLLETVIGFLVGALLGVALAIICYYQPLLNKVLQPFLDVLNALPRVVLSPLFILWFGLGVTSKAVLAASLVLFIVLNATLTGLKEVDQNLIHRLRLMGASNWALLRHALLPAGLTWVFSSLRSSVGFAMAGAVVGEYVGSSRGLGYQIALSEGNLDATGIFAGLVILSAIVIVMNGLLGYLERRLTPWRVEQGATA